MSLGTLNCKSAEVCGVRDMCVREKGLRVHPLGADIASEVESQDWCAWCTVRGRRRPTMRDQVSRQVQTEMRKSCKKEAPSIKRHEKGPETEAWGEQEDACRERRSEPARLASRSEPTHKKPDAVSACVSRAEHAKTSTKRYLPLSGE